MCAENLIASSMKCLIDKPTRITETSKTLLDHIYTKIIETSLYSGICINDISHHFPVLIIAPKNKSPPNKLGLHYIRHLKNFDTERFADLTTSLSNFLVTETKPINDQLSEFLKIFTGIVNKHAPLRSATRKEKRLKAKPWLFPGLLKSIKRQNKMFSNLHCKFDQNLFEHFKRYRNILNRAILKAKETYYNKKVLKNKHEPGKLGYNL